MRHVMSRRDLVRSAAAAGAAVFFSRAAGAAEAAAAGPGLHVGCRDSHLKVTGAADCWAALAAIGADGVEASIDDALALGGLHPKGYSVADAAGIERLAADAKAAGKRISALCMANRFEERPDAEVAWCAKAARAAKALGVPAIRIDVVPRTLARDAFLKLATETLKKVMDATEETGVAFGIENHGNTTNDPEFLKALFDGVGAKRLGLTLDTGNFYWYGHPLSKLYAYFEAFAPRVFHTHCKNIKYPEAEREKKRPMGWEYGKYNCPIDEGDVDFRKIVAILKKAGYANDLCVEDESLGKFPAAEQVVVLAREVKYLKGLL
jgi:sugar phosphate isomerase/epimerase